MSLFIPTYHLNRLTDINIDLLKKLNIKTVLLDVDNTISSHNSLELFDGALDWIDNLKAQNIKILIASNNYKRRVKPISKAINVDFLYFSLKPLPFRINRFLKNYNIKKSETLIIGDQIFSDILFANLFGIKSILLEPQAAGKNSLTLKMKRKIEKYIKKSFKNKGANL